MSNLVNEAILLTANDIMEQWTGTIIEAEMKHAIESGDLEKVQELINDVIKLEDEQTKEYGEVF